MLFAILKTPFLSIPSYTLDGPTLEMVSKADGAAVRHVEPVGRVGVEPT